MSIKDKTYIYVMDFCSGGIYEIELEELYEDIDVEKVLDEYGFNIDEVDFMITNNRKINIIKLTK